MLISRNWLNEFVALDNKTDEELAADITLHTVEVEGTAKLGALLDHVVVGVVEKVEKHPDADRLNVCQVNVGKEIVQVVCGGSNVVEGMHVAMGMIGAKVQWHGEGAPVELKKTKIRGVESFGMICAADEIGLGDLFRKDDEKEILDLSGLHADIGTPLLELLALDDTVIDVDNKSMTHRPDLWGHYGLARDIAAMYGKNLKPYPAASFDEGKQQALKVSVKDQDLCPRYMGVMLDGITIGPSPQWMQKRLAAVGINPINNIVDITNYVMAELGQPMHAFDADSLHSAEILVRKAKEQENIMLLGGDEVALSSDMLVIADKHRPIAIAGVKGGGDSAVTNATTRIIFEAANFQATSVRRTSQALGIRTDASARFEKALDPNAVALAMQRAVALTVELCPGARVVSNISDVHDFTLDQGPVDLDLTFVNRKIGVDVPKDFVVQTLERLGFALEDHGESLRVTVPTWRATKDVRIPEDLIEEIARMYGYDNITPKLPEASIEAPPADPLRALKKVVREQLAYASRYTEVYNYCFTSTEWVEKMQVPTENLLELDNPVAKDRPYLRRNLMPNMLANAEKNLHRYDAVRLFEIGKTFLGDDEGEEDGGKGRLPKQDTYLGMCYAERGNDTPFYGAADAIRQLGQHLGLSVTFQQLNADEDMLHPGRCAAVQFDGEVVGKIAELHPVSQQTLGIPHRTAMVELNLSKVIPLLCVKSAYHPLSAYPAVQRDVALLVDTSIEDAAVRQKIQKASCLIESVDLFDVYTGKGIEEGKKSMAYRLTYRAKKETLTSEKVDAEHEKVMALVESAFGAIRR